MIISSFRRGIGEKTAQIFLWLLVLSLAGIGSFSGIFRRLSGLPTHVIASVNGRDISDKEFQERVHMEEQKIAFYVRQFGEAAPAILASMGLDGDVRTLALRELVQDMVLTDCADATGIAISPEYGARLICDRQFVAQYLSAVLPPEIIGKTGIDKTVLRAYLSRRGLTVSDFEEAVAAALKRYMVGSLVTLSSYAPEYLVRRRFIEKYVPRTYHVVTVPLSLFIKKAQKEELSDDAIRAFYDEQNTSRHRYWTQEQRSGTVWRFSGKKDDAGFQQQFSADAERVLSFPREAFLEFVSDHKGTQSSLRTITMGESPAGDALFRLAEGSRTYGFDEKGGAFIVELSTIVPSEIKPFESIKDTVKTDLYENKAAMELADAVSESLSSNEAYDAFIKEHNLKVEPYSMLKPESDRWNELGQKGLPMDRLALLTIPGTSLNHMGYRTGYLVKLQALGHVDEALYAQHRGELRKLVEREQESLRAYGFIASLTRAATLITNPDVLSARVS